MELKIFTDRCITCQESERIDVIRFIAKKHGMKIDIKRVYVFPELRKEADEYNTKMPFLAINKKTMDFYAVGKYLSKDEALEQFINEESK